jgi:thiol:disulfide interchange protein DsbD
LALFVALAALALFAPRSHAEDNFLEPEQAFAFSAHAVGADKIELNWKIAPGYYMYREQFHFVSDPAGVALGTPDIPPGKIKFDETFNKNVETYRDSVTIRMPIPVGGQPFTLIATGQGCADAGLCYPPDPHRVRIVPAAAAGASPAVDDGSSIFGGGLSGLLHADDEGLAGLLSGSSVLQTVLAFFALGILLSLTPCVLPMVPILSSILVGASSTHSRRPRLRGFGLAALYVAGMSVVYTVVGVLAGLSGESIAASFQTPWVLGAFALLLAVLALAMFDVFTFQLPASWQSGLSAKASRMPGGRALGTLAMGALSALIVGPCVAAPLAGALLYISQTRDVVLGGLALFALAWGMGVPLLAAGASAGALLPKSGAWMDDVKHFFGMLLLAVAWWMLWPVLPGWVQMAGWAVLAIMTAALLNAFDALPASAGLGRRLAKGLGILFALAGVLQAVGAASGGNDPLLPLSHLARHGDATASLAQTGPILAPSVEGAAAQAAAAQAIAPGAAIDVAPADAGPSAAWSTGSPAAGAAPFATSSAKWSLPAMSRPAVPIAATVPPGTFEPVRSVAELDAVLAASDRPVMLDFYADWCVSCKEMEASTFTRPAVAQKMAQMRLLRADVTANNADDRALLKRFKLFGPPGIVFFGKSGQPIAGARVIGFQGEDRFGRTLDAVLARNAD